MGLPKIIRLQMGRPGLGRNSNLWRVSRVVTIIRVRVSASDNGCVMGM